MTSDVFPNSALGRFLTTLENKYPAFRGAGRQAELKDRDAFHTHGETLARWAERLLGTESANILSDGYARFVTDVTKEQLRYEQRGKYLHSSYADVFKEVYGNPGTMDWYHWGVFVTTFLWPHHLELLTFFLDRFVDRRLPQRARLVDLGTGSGVWSAMALQQRPDLTAHGVDISETSVALANRLASVAGTAGRYSAEVADALAWSGSADAGISCFLLEHLEKPEALIATLGRNLAAGAPAFVIGAITAAETDHIYEFKHESDLVRLLEANDFRVAEILSAHPEPRRNAKYLPRSMAAIVIKKSTALW